MSNTSAIAGALLLAFAIFVISRGELPIYMGILGLGPNPLTGAQCGATNPAPASPAAAAPSGGGGTTVVGGGTTIIEQPPAGGTSGGGTSSNSGFGIGQTWEPVPLPSGSGDGGGDGGGDGDSSGDGETDF